MVQQAALGFIVLAPVMLAVRALFSAGYLIYIGALPAFFLDVHLPYAMAAAFVGSMAVACLQRPSRKTWWVVAWWTSTVTVVAHLLLIELMRGINTGVEYWLLLLGPWLTATAIASLVGALVFGGRAGAPERSREPTADKLDIT